MASSTCRRFRKLRLSEDEGRLSAASQRAMRGHIDACSGCREWEGQILLSSYALLSARMDYTGPEDFASRVIRAISNDRLRRQLLVWRPTLAGAITAAVAIGAILQVLTASPKISPAAGFDRATVPVTPERKRTEVDLFELPAPEIRNFYLPSG